jgi:hypothetical protein
VNDRQKTISIKRSDREVEADKRAAEAAQMNVHAWRRFVLNAANGLSRCSDQLARMMRGRE